jgi:DNA modification methylase
LNREFKLEALREDVKFQGGWTKEHIHEVAQEIVGSRDSSNLVNYLSWLFERLVLIHEHLCDSGSIFLHIGTREAPYVSLLMDRIFGFANWRSTITWQRSHPHNNMTKSLGNVSDFIFYYSKSDSFTFNLQYTPHDEKYLRNSFRNSDEKGNYALAPIIQERSRDGHFYEFKGLTPPFGWRVKETELKKLDEAGYIHWGSNRPYKKIYLSEAQGALLQNIWTDIHNITRTEVDSRRYPTQKPIKLLERIISLSSNENDLVYDPFCGSGTTLVAAKKLGRKFLGTDISPDSIRISLDRLALVDEENGLFG